VAVIGSVAAGEFRRAAFTMASHRGWDIAAACGGAIAVLAYLTTGARARAAAAMAGAEAPADPALDRSGT
jgi:xanthine/CO dehydrogenase XdhC/CoxF family maturation factor